VEAEALSVQGEGALPFIAVVDLAQGNAFSPGTKLDVKVNTSAAGGIDEVKLYLNGLVLDRARGSDPYV